MGVELVQRIATTKFHPRCFIQMVCVSSVSFVRFRRAWLKSVCQNSFVSHASVSTLLHVNNQRQLCKGQFTTSHVVLTVFSRYLL